ncbi:hypothetical protein BB561_005404 [Smittium simulii]|uniref:Eukaryotic translation initiation factor 3 subunit C n=1 Tax=Smittium simulii TaxID=133385 RepID=A0A2T9YAK5_9FUNG|nr:hypothetical protein BB561_005404 [Smittium simulii]
MSRFFKGNSSDSGSDSSSSSDSDFSDNESRQLQSTAPRFSRSAISDSDDSDTEVKRVVKSAKDKQLDEAQALVKTITSSLKANSWSTVLSEFEKLTKLLPKLKKSQPTNKPPIFVIRSLVSIESNLDNFKDKNSTKKLKADDARALNTIKQRIKKVLKENQAEIAAYKASPIASEDENASDGDSQPIESKIESAPKASKAQQDSRNQKALQKKAAKELELSDDDGFTVVGKKSKPKSIYNSDNLRVKLAEIASSRGRKGVDKFEVLRNLEQIYEVAINPLQKTKVLLILIPSQFDTFADSNPAFTSSSWLKVLALINNLLGVLESAPSISISENADSSNLTNDDTKFVNENIVLSGSVIGFLERLCDEFTRNLVALDPHTTEYVERMADDMELYITIVRSQKYLELHNQQNNVSRVIMKRLEFLYYRPDPVVITIEEKMYKSINEPATTDPSELINKLCSHMFNHDSPMFRTRAMLMGIFNHALHKRYYVARDLFLMSHIQDTISQADIDTQILFNRTLSQLSLAAFRIGLISESFSHIYELMSSGRVRELLGQGVGLLKYNQFTPEQEKLGKLHQLPFHMHINFELLECVFLVSSMLLEIPSMAASINNIGEHNNKVISKVFRKMFDYSERQIFTGPPESTRDYIMAASKALATGDWSLSYKNLCDIKIWNLMPDNVQVKDMMFNEIKLQALKTYLFTYFTHYDSISITSLAQMFDFSNSKVSSILAGMIYNSEIGANLDELSQTIKFFNSSSGASLRLQQVTIQMADKVSAFVETNEKIYELKINGGKPLTGEKSAFQQQPSQQNYDGHKQNRQNQNRQRGNQRNNQNRRQNK